MARPQRVFEAAHSIVGEPTLADRLAAELNDGAVAVLDRVDSGGAEPEPEMVNGWWLMDTAPQNRAIFLTSEPMNDQVGLLCFWRTTRHKEVGVRGWQVRSFWAAVLNRREVEFSPAGWREANGMPIHA